MFFCEPVDEGAECVGGFVEVVGLPAFDFCKAIVGLIVLLDFSF